MQTFIISNLRFDAGEVAAIIFATTGKTVAVSTGGNIVTINPDLTQAEVDACKTAIQNAPDPDPHYHHDYILQVARNAAETINGLDVTTLTAAQTRLLVILLAAQQGWVKWNGSVWVVNVHQ